MSEFSPEGETKDMELAPTQGRSSRPTVQQALIYRIFAIKNTRTARFRVFFAFIRRNSSKSFFLRLSRFAALSLVLT